MISPVKSRHKLGTLLVCCGLGAAWMSVTAAADDVSAPEVLRALMAWQQRKPGAVLVGQQSGHGEFVPWGIKEWVLGVEKETGVAPSIVGADYAYGKARTDTPDLAVVNAELVRQWNAGRLITVSWHAKNPVTGGTAWDVTPVQLRALTNSATPEGKVWHRELDRIAAALGDLQKAGVVVLWRPFHEMNGRWFWWGNPPDKTGPERRGDFVALWNHMRTYFRSTKGLKNLLWVYCASDGAHSASEKHPERAVGYYYPGPEACDIVALDSYRNPFALTGYAALRALNKPMAVAEFGPVEKSGVALDLADTGKTIARDYPGLIYCVAWDGPYALKKQINTRQFMEQNRPPPNWRAWGNAAK